VFVSIDALIWQTVALLDLRPEPNHVAITLTAGLRCTASTAAGGTPRVRRIAEATVRRPIMNTPRQARKRQG
jgi:hypothetical protein